MTIVTHTSAAGPKPSLQVRPSRELYDSLIERCQRARGILEIVALSIDHNSDRQNMDWLDRSSAVRGAKDIVAEAQYFSNADGPTDWESMLELCERAKALVYTIAQILKKEDLDLYHSTEAAREFIVQVIERIPSIDDRVLQ